MKAGPGGRILIGMLAGVVLGAVLGERVAAIQPLGDLFIALLVLAAVPLVFFNLLAGLTSLADTRTLGRLAGKTLGYFLTTDLIALSLGLGAVALRSRPIAVAGFAAFGILSGFSNAFDAQSTPAHGVAMAAVSTGAAIVALLWFTRANPVAAIAGDAAAAVQFQRQRRVFLGSGAVVALAAVVTGVLGRNLIEGAKVAVASRDDIVLPPVRSRAAAAAPSPAAAAVETPAATPAPVATAAPAATQAPLTTPAPVATPSATEAATPAPEATVAASDTPTPIEVEAATGSLPPETMFDVRGISSIITPNRDFYRIDTAFSIPRVDVEGWELKITGLVDSPYSLTYRELLDLATDEDYVTLCCVSNEVGGRLIGNAKWQGVRPHGEGLRDEMAACDRDAERGGLRRLVEPAGLVEGKAHLDTDPHRRAEGVLVRHRARPAGCCGGGVGAEPRHQQGRSAT